MPYKRKPWSERKERQLELLAINKAALIQALGGECELCGSTWPLEFHHDPPRTWNIRKCNRWTRLARYKREAALGALTLRCENCNRGENGYHH